MKIYIIRHGETTGDLEDRYGGDYEDHLTSKGRVQATELSKGLVDKDIDVIFSSPKIRAQETSQILRQGIRSHVELISDLRERNAYGVLTGMIKTEAMEKYPDEVTNLLDYNSNITGAERYEDFKSRVVSVFENIAAKPYRTMALVTHGGVIRCFVREILKLGELKKLGDCAYLALEYDDNYKLIDLNNVESA